MENYFTLMKQIDEIIEKINIILNAELTINIDDSSGEMFPTMGQRGEWNLNIKRLVKEYIDKFYKYSHLYKVEDLPLILEFLEKLKLELNKTLSMLNDRNNYKSINENLEKVKDLISKPFDLDLLKFEFKKTFSQDEILKIYENIKRFLQDFDVDEEIIKFINDTEDNDKKLYLLNYLIDLYNLHLENNTYLSGRKTEKILNEIEKLIQHSNREKATQLVNETNEMVVHVKENLGLSKNEKLLMIFKNEAKELSEKIDNLNTTIIGILSLLIIGFFTMILNSIFPTDLKHYLLYVSLLIVISALLTYLIKDRVRLIEFQDYCKRMYMEITALPDYMATLTTEQQEALRISLSSNYFTGNQLTNNLTQPKHTNDNVATIEALSKIIQSIKPSN